VTGRIARGLLLSSASPHATVDAQLEWMVDKVLGLRIFADAEDR
jgi:D-Tyr-tRNAtyr deacylase